MSAAVQNLRQRLRQLWQLLVRYWFVAPLLMAALWLREWVESPQTDPLTESTIDMRTTRTDYYLEDFHTRHFNDQGQLEYEVSGLSLSHLKDEQRAEVREPKVVFRRDDVVWDIRAESGELLDPPHEQLRLEGEVVIERSGANAGDLQLVTSDLLIQPATREILTEAPVTLRGDGWQLSATGLQSSLDTGKLRLPADVTARYELPP